MVTSGSTLYGTRSASHSHAHPLSHSSHLHSHTHAAAPHVHAPLRRSRPAPEERLFGPLKAEHVLWIIGVLLFYFYVWGRLFGSHTPSRAHSLTPAHEEPHAQAHSKAQAHPPPPSPSVAHSKGAGVSPHAKHGAHRRAHGSAKPASGVAGEAEPRGRSALDEGMLPRGKSGEGKGAASAHQAVGAPPALVAGAGGGEGAMRADGHKDVVERLVGGKEGGSLGRMGGKERRVAVDGARGGVGDAGGGGDGSGRVKSTDLNGGVQGIGVSGREGVGMKEEAKEEVKEQGEGQYEVPYIVRRFRAGVVDWHDYVPQPALPLQSDDPEYMQVRAAYGLHLLGQAEAKVARFFAGDSFRQHRHGPLLDHSVCGVLSDPCALHASSSDCLWDGFCAWCHASAVCIDRSTPMAAACSQQLAVRDVSPYRDRILRDAAKYVRVAAGGEMEHHVPAKQNLLPATAAAAATGNSTTGASESPCKFIIPGHFQFLTLDYDEMYWHWLLENYVPLLADMPYARLRDMRTHFILTRSTSTRHLPFLGLLSQSCWRSIGDMEEGTCLVEETKEESLRFKMEHPSAMATAAQLIDRTAPHFIVDRLNLSHIPPPSKPRVLIVARRRRRLLLNEDALLAATRAMGLPASIAVFEDLPLYEQILAVRSCAILVGVHGSGLLNSMFLHPGSVLVQIVPYNATGADRFYEPQVRQAGGSYMEVRITNRSDSVFHWHLAEDHGSPVGTMEERERFLQQGPDVQRASDVFFSFWVNQDVRVPLEEYRRVIGEAVKVWEQQQQGGGQGAGLAEEGDGNAGGRLDGRGGGGGGVDRGTS